MSAKQRRIDELRDLEWELCDNITDLERSLKRERNSLDDVRAALRKLEDAK